jgi:hypothetical protein
MSGHLEICNYDCVAHGGSYRPVADEMGFRRSRPGSPGVLGRYPTPPPSTRLAKPEVIARTVLTPDLPPNKAPWRAAANTPSIVTRLYLTLAGSAENPHVELRLSAAGRRPRDAHGLLQPAWWCNGWRL